MPAGNLVDRVAEIIPRYNMLSAGDRIGVAVSGGADSVALLHILYRLSAQFRIELAVLHVNHQLRGAESEEDEAFVRALAGSLGLEAQVVHSRPEEGNLEQEARRARRAFFRECMERGGLKRVALGHTRSDQAETVLLRLFRGSGLAGLSGMRMVSPEGWIRPLLSTSRHEVREWARAENLAWREDSSNADSRFARNLLRNEAIPALSRHFNPNLEGVLAGTAELAQDEEEYWAQEIEGIYPKITKRTQTRGYLGLILQVRELSAYKRAVQRRLIRRILCDIRKDLRSLDQDHVEAILRVCSSTQGHDRVVVPGADVLRSFETVLFTRPGELASVPRQYRLEIKAGEERQLPYGAGVIALKVMKPEPRNCVNFKEAQQFPAEVEHLDGDALTDRNARFEVRNWEPGDALQRSGHGSAEKVKSLFQEHRILLWERRHWPVLVAGEEIVWVRRFGVAAKFRAASGSRQPIRLIYVPGE